MTTEATAPPGMAATKQAENLRAAQNDIRHIFVWLRVQVVVMLLILGGFGWMDARIVRLEDKIDSRLFRMEEKVDDVEEKVNQLSDKVGDLDDRLDRLEGKIDRLLREREQ